MQGLEPDTARFALGIGPDWRWLVDRGELFGERGSRPSRRHATGEPGLVDREDIFEAVYQELLCVRSVDLLPRRVHEPGGLQSLKRSVYAGGIET